MWGFLISVVLFWSYLSLVAAGLQFLYGSMRIVNLAHGSFFVLGGFLASYLAGLVPLYVAIPLATLSGAAAGVLFYIFIQPALGDESRQLLATFTLFWLMEAFFRLAFGQGLYNTADLAGSFGQLQIGDQILPVANLYGIASVFILFAVLYLVTYKTTFGMYLRAAVDNAEMARSLGVPVPKIVLASSALGLGVAAFGGALSSMWQNFTLGLAGTVLVYAFAAVAISGLGSVYGVLLSSLIVSLIRTAAVYYAPQFEIFAIYIAVLGVLAARPSGLFVKYERRV